MKKFITAILSLALAALMSFPAFAENTATNNGGETNVPVNGIFTPAQAPSEVISADIAWDDMSFTYTAPSNGKWNPTSHTYENPVAGGWAWDNATETKTAPVISVTNHSNVPVKAVFSFGTSISELNGLFSAEELVLDTAEKTSFDNAPKAETSFSVSGGEIDQNKDLGSVTVTVANATTTVSTAEELLATAGTSGYYKLANDINIGEKCLYISASNYILDLNGHTLSCAYKNFASIRVYSTTSAQLTMRNGTVLFTNDTGNGITVFARSVAILENCTLIGHRYVLDTDAGTAHITDCKFSTEEASIFTVMNTRNGTMTVSGNVEILSGAGFSNQAGKLSVLEGTYNFDPTDFVKKTDFTITDNSNGTWTVTAK